MKQAVTRHKMLPSGVANGVNSSAFHIPCHEDWNQLDFAPFAFTRTVILGSLETATLSGNMNSKTPSHYSASQPRILYGWYIVGVGLLSHTVCAFHLSSSLRVFLRPFPEELCASRGVF